MNIPMITAHSGCEETEIDSMESIELALEYGADAIEVDVRVDHNKELRIGDILICNRISLIGVRT